VLLSSPLGLDLKALAYGLLQIDTNPLFAPAVHVVTGLDVDNPDFSRDRHAAESAGKRLFVLVRMLQLTLAQVLARFVNHSPGIGVVFPTRIAMPQGRLDGPGIALFFEHSVLDLHLVCEGRKGNPKQQHEAETQPDCDKAVHDTSPDYSEIPNKPRET
jgi:hypothetical protein